jgi:hypothetical protein
MHEQKIRYRDTTAPHPIDIQQVPLAQRTLAAPLPTFKSP